jgi:hypothetical protein
MPGHGDTDVIQELQKQNALQKAVIDDFRDELESLRKRLQNQRHTIAALQQTRQKATRVAWEAWDKRDRYKLAADTIYLDYCELYAAVCGDKVENVVGKLLGHEVAVDDANQARIDQERYEAVRQGMVQVIGPDGALRWQASIDQMIKEAQVSHDPLPNS